MKACAAIIVLLVISTSTAGASSEGGGAAIPAAISPESQAHDGGKVQEAAAQSVEEAYYLDRNGTTRRHSQDDALAKMKLHFSWSQDQCWETDLETGGRAVSNLTRNSNCRPGETFPLFEPSTGRCMIVDAETKGSKYREEGPLTACRPSKTLIVWKTARNYPNCFEVDAETKGAKYSDPTIPHLACAPDRVSCNLESDGWHLRETEGPPDGFDSRAAGRQVCGKKGLDPNRLSAALQQLSGPRDSRVDVFPLNPVREKGAGISGALPTGEGPRSPDDPEESSPAR